MWFKCRELYRSSLPTDIYLWPCSFLALHALSHPCVKVATGKKKIADLEDEILRLLSESTGSLLDDVNLVDTLQDSKIISEEVTQQLQVTVSLTDLRIEYQRNMCDIMPCSVRW